MFEEWSNAACLGYTIKAMTNCGFSEDEIQRITDNMNVLFDFVPVNEAKEIYQKSKF